MNTETALAVLDGVEVALIIAATIVAIYVVFLTSGPRRVHRSR